LWPNAHSSILLITAQTSLQQSTYKNTTDIHEVVRDIHEVARGIHEVSKNIDQTTKGIAEDMADIICKARETTVSVVRGTVVIKALMFLIGRRNPGQT
jgi:methyl-accepting chemotaxis protein